ncbi:MAG: sigma-54-dependent Fis family transcriptional regulator [Candidatus Tectomicrobia bacterium]|uniref:Sigma-54-dependent Fis family transcriptional regulator n=1 Tax=Tectimicrobiota bacterium TaxID=2528274 RepID=A0A933GMJ7_UNCTE|nr:sigma-54-dependent Fis family transcriptional regulator [Candidatus Tectomicrobia bacterium]
MPSILVVEDNDSQRLTLSILLKTKGYKVSEASRGKEAIQKLESDGFDIVVTDLKIDEFSGLDILKSVKSINTHTEVLILTGYGTIESAIEATRLGAFNYLTKPVDKDQLIHNIEKALERKKLLKEVKSLTDQVKSPFNLGNIIGHSKEMKHVLELTAKVAKTDATILIIGESGTGKELIAKAIHYQSPRDDKPFLAINCGALPETLLESELFGYTKGSFTGATGNKRGLFEEANSGTLFLDEIGDTSLSTQVKLLRVLQEQEIRRIGSNFPIKINVRILAATNKKLEDLVNQGKFREDLYYRLSVIPLVIPPLRERKEDIPTLIEHFLQKYSRELNKSVSSVSPEALRVLQNYHWRGNVRELENCIERAVILAPFSVITPDDLSLGLLGHKEEISALKSTESITLRELEKRYIVEVLEEYDWNQAKVAKKLGIGRNTLWRKLKQYGLKRNDSSIME